MDKKNLLITLADKNYINQAKQLFSSVYWNAGWKGDYMLLAQEIPEKELKWFRDKGILIKKCKPLYNKMIGIDEHPGTVVTKFYLFTPEFKKWKNIIYLDADMIIKFPLNKLTKVKNFAAIPELYMGRVCTIKEQFSNIPKKTFDEVKSNYNIHLPSFNAGLIVFNTNIIADDTFTQLIHLLNKYSSICRYGEQAILNLFFKKWSKLPLIYNVCINFSSEYPPKRAIIFHFSGIKKIHKPWNPENIFYNEWKNNLGKAEFIDLTKIPKRKSKVFKIQSYNLLLEIKSFFIRLFNKIDKIIGQGGILLKRFNPNLYYKLKKIKL